MASKAENGNGSASKAYKTQAAAKAAAKREFGENWADSVEIFSRNGGFVYDFPLRGEDQAAAVIEHAREKAHAAVDQALKQPVREFLAETAAESKKRKAKEKELKAKKPIHEPATASESAPQGSDQAEPQKPATAVIPTRVLPPEHPQFGETLTAQAQADKAANAALVNESAGADPLKPRLSTAEKPTKLVWAIADEMPGKSRKDVIAACVARGIAYGTARTQYQHWFKTKNDSAAAPKAKHENGKVIPPSAAK